MSLVAFACSLVSLMVLAHQMDAAVRSGPPSLYLWLGIGAVAAVVSALLSLAQAFGRTA